MDDGDHFHAVRKPLVHHPIVPFDQLAKHTLLELRNHSPGIRELFELAQPLSNPVGEPIASPVRELVEPPNKPVEAVQGPGRPRDRQLSGFSP